MPAAATAAITGAGGDDGDDGDYEARGVPCRRRPYDGTSIDVALYAPRCAHAMLSAAGVEHETFVVLGTGAEAQQRRTNGLQVDTQAYVRTEAGAWLPRPGAGGSTAASGPANYEHAQRLVRCLSERPIPTMGELRRARTVARAARGPPIRLPAEDAAGYGLQGVLTYVLSF